MVSVRFAAIRTTYRGVSFRSRLEATWAAFFDEMRWKWDYEPFDMDGWIPDFEVAIYGNKILVEVKPAHAYEDLVAATEGPQLAGRDVDVLLLGLRPIGLDYYPRNRAGWDEIFAVGIDNQRCWIRGPGPRTWEPSGLHRCRWCGFVGWNEPCKDKSCRADNKGSDGMADLIVQSAWNRAKNATQWKKAH